MTAVAFVPFSWPIAFVAFFAERLIDIAKVQPARWAERRIPGGAGDVIDDLIAGVYARVFVELFRHVL